MMEWIALAIIVAILIWIGWGANKKEAKKNSRYLSELQDNIQQYQALLLRGQLPCLNPVQLGYRPVGGEAIYASVNGVKDNRDRNEGRLLVTSKAIVLNRPRGATDFR